MCYQEGYLFRERGMTTYWSGVSFHASPVEDKSDQYENNDHYDLDQSEPILGFTCKLTLNQASTPRMDS